MNHRQMKKAIIAVVVIGLVSVGGYLGIMVMRPGARVCRQIASLWRGAKEAANTCVSNMEEMQQTLAPDQFRRATDCIVHAKSCAEVEGCRIGMDLRSLGNAFADFLKGVSRELPLRAGRLVANHSCRAIDGRDVCFDCSIARRAELVL